MNAYTLCKNLLVSYEQKSSRHDESIVCKTAFPFQEVM